MLAKAASGNPGGLRRLWPCGATCQLPARAAEPWSVRSYGAAPKGWSVPSGRVSEQACSSSIIVARAPPVGANGHSRSRIWTRSSTAEHPPLKRRAGGSIPLGSTRSSPERANAVAPGLSPGLPNGRAASFEVAGARSTRAPGSPISDNRSRNDSRRCSPHLQGIGPPMPVLRRSSMVEHPPVKRARESSILSVAASPAHRRAHGHTCRRRSRGRATVSYSVPGWFDSTRRLRVSPRSSSGSGDLSFKQRRRVRFPHGVPFALEADLVVAPH